MANVRLIIDIVNWGCDEAFFDHGLSDGLCHISPSSSAVETEFHGTPGAKCQEEVLFGKKAGEINAPFRHVERTLEA